jgi:hypothetical protein
LSLTIHVGGRYAECIMATVITSTCDIQTCPGVFMHANLCHVQHCVQLAEHSGTSSSSATTAAIASTAVDRKRVRHTHDEHGRAVKKQRPTVSFNDQQLSTASTAVARSAAAAAASFNTSQHSSNSVMDMSCDSSDSIQTVYKQSFYDTEQCNADTDAAVAAATAAMQADHTEIETALMSQVQRLTAKVYQLEDQVCVTVSL